MRQLTSRQFLLANTLSLNSISALYPVFSQFMVTTPPNSIVRVPIKIPGGQKT